MSFIASLRDRAILIFGAGVTGNAAADYLQAIGARPRLIDEKLSTAEFSDTDFSEYELAIVSPGWQLDHKLIAAARSSGVKLLSEIDFAWRIKSELRPDQRWLALTGTNGKTTTVQMAAAMIAQSGLRVRACGNVGDTVISAVANEELDLLVLELSSFQLAWSDEAQFEAAAILNIAEDHLDWHGSFNEYAHAKFKISAMSRCLIANQDDPEIRSRLAGVATRIVTYTLGSPAPHQIGLVENLVVDRAFIAKEAEVLFELNDLKTIVPHNLSNAMAAAALARAVGVKPDAISHALRNFQLDHHRLELIKEVDGIRWIDDSKATNPHAALAALRSQMSAIWIAGGLSKGANMDELVKAGANRIKAAILIGTDAPKIESALKAFAPQVEIFQVDSALRGAEVMRSAVTIAKELAQSGDCVLLAPACASMDQFKNYAERGDLFAEAVRELIDEN